MITNTSPQGYAYGIHNPHHPTIAGILVDAMTNGTDETYDAAVADIKDRVKSWLDDSEGIDDTTAVHPYLGVGSDTVIDGLFYDFIAEALKAADVISYHGERSTKGADFDLIESVAEHYGSDDEGEAPKWDWDEVFDLVLQHVNDGGYISDGEPHAYTYEQAVKLEDGTEHPVKMMVSPLGGAQLLWVMESPYITPCAGCSPCIPGGGDLDTPTDFFDPTEVRAGRYDPSNGKWAYCLPPQWFKEDGEPIPYEEVYLAQSGTDAEQGAAFMTQVWPNNRKRFYGETA